MQQPKLIRYGAALLLVLWLVIFAAGATSTRVGGGVSGPVSSTDNVAVRWDGTSGTVVQNSNLHVLDAGNVGVGGSPTAMFQVQTATDNGSNVLDTSKVLIGGNTDSGNIAGLQIGWNQSTRTAILNAVVPNVAFGDLALQPYGGSVKVANLGVSTAGAASSRLQVVTVSDSGGSSTNTTTFFTVGGDGNSSSAGSIRLSYDETADAGYITATHPGFTWDPVCIQPYGTGNVGVGTNAPDKKLEINLGTSSALRLSYDDANGSAANVTDFTVSSAGNLTINPSGGGVSLPKTITAGGTTGAQTINKASGSVNFAAAASSLVVTNSLVTTSSVIICTVGTNDSTAKSALAVATSGSFTIHLNAAATAETRVNFLVTN